jgi:hypothetical protein
MFNCVFAGMRSAKRRDNKGLVFGLTVTLMVGLAFGLPTTLMVADHTPVVFLLSLRQEYAPLSKRRQE